MNEKKEDNKITNKEDLKEDTEKEKEDLKKAISFLISKDLQDYSLEKKKEFLCQKLPKLTVEKAMEIYPLILNNIHNKIEEYKQNENKSQTSSMFSSFFDIGILSSVLLATFGINYILDLNRNKKNDLFYKEIEKKLNEELVKNTNEMKEEISNQLSSYVKIENINDKVNEQLTSFTNQRGLNLNLSNKTVKDDIICLKKELEENNTKIKEAEVKIEQNKLLLKEEILTDIKKLIEENSKQLLVKIIENQDKLLVLGKEASASDKNSIPAQNNTCVDNTISTNKINEKKDDDFESNLISALQGINDDEKSKVLGQLLIQFRTINEAKESGNPAMAINIRHANFKSINQILLTKLLISAGFVNSDGTKYTIDENKFNELEKGLSVLEKLDNSK
jgi:hypothetical protein